jgi:hypothetical protein
MFRPPFRLIANFAAAIVFAIAVSARASPTTVQATNTAVGDQQPWSAEINGLSARVSVEEREVVNGTPIFSVYLELRNSRDLANAMTIPWPGDSLKFNVTDEAGIKVPQGGVVYDGMEVKVPDLVLPHDSTIRVNVSKSGAGVSGDQAALLDLGADQTWTLPRDHRHYRLSAVLDIPERKEKGAGRWSGPWHGRIEIPSIEILDAESASLAQAPDPTFLGRRIDELGTAMLGRDGQASERAMSDLSMIEDPRVVPWYVKAMNVDSYELKFSALDRLSRFQGDEALEGLKKGMTTRGADIANCTTPGVASSMANNIRVAAAQALMRSADPRAKSLILTMVKDACADVRIQVAQAATAMQSSDSLNVLRTLTGDSDATVQAEAKRCLEVRLAKK